MSDDQLFALMRRLVLLLFIGSGLLLVSRSRTRLAWWMRRAAVVLYAIAAGYSLLLVWI